MKLRKLKIKSIKKTDRIGHVYDLSVTKNHNFFIGESETLTHNCDYLTPNSQAALRNLMETFSKTTRFILTCNFVEKVIDPIQSRCHIFEVHPPGKKEVAQRLVTILTEREIEFSNSDVAKIINSNFPDIRRVINAAQNSVVDGKLILDSNTLIQSNYMTEILKVLQSTDGKGSKFKTIRQIIADSKVRDFTGLYRYLFEELDTYGTGHIAQCILILAEAQSTDSFAVDKELHVMAMFIKLLNELSNG